MSTTATATATVEVACDPETAFAVFTDEIGVWWKRSTMYWNDAERGLRMRFEPTVGGRLVEVYDDKSDEGFEVGRVLAWDPGKRLVFTWRQDDWGSGEDTEVEVSFEPTVQGTRVTIEHSGWDRVPSLPSDMPENYGHGWGELLGFFAEHVSGR